MKNFSKRERGIISRVYRDAARICWERERESRRGGHDEVSTKWMAAQLKDLMLVRREQILKYGCDLPRQRKLK